MTSNKSGCHTFLYSRYTENPPLSIDKGYMKDIKIEISSDDDDMTIFQLMSMFKSYCISVGYAEKSFTEACEYMCNEI